MVPKGISFEPQRSTNESDSLGEGYSFQGPYLTVEVSWKKYEHPCLMKISNYGYDVITLLQNECEQQNKNLLKTDLMKLSVTLNCDPFNETSASYYFNRQIWPLKAVSLAQ